jgi:hypothetical protein
MEEPGSGVSHGRPRGNTLLDVTAGFDWSLIRSEEWTALSAFGDAPQHVSRGLYRVAPGIFAMTDRDEGVPSNPGVGAILWAESDEVALLIYDHALPRSDRRGPVYPPPPPDVLVFEPLTYAAARAYERQRSDGPLGEFASYGRLDGDGAHRTTSFRGVGRKYYFREVNPEGEASIIAVKFTVSPIPGVLSRQPHVD